MTTVATYLAAEGEYLKPDAIDVIRSFSDDELAIFRAAGEEIDDNWTQLVETRETLADFDRARAEHWTERGAHTLINCGGRPAMLFERFQVGRGAPRCAAMMVVDLGERRIALR